MDERFPLVTVVVPVRDGMPYLEECLDSVLAQTYPHLEVVVVDDGSSDATGDYLARLGDERVHVAQSEGRGVSHARNVGLALARGSYVAFVDADDWVGEDFVRNALGHMLAANLDVVVGGMERVYPNGHTRLRMSEAPPPLMCFDRADRTRIACAILNGDAEELPELAGFSLGQVTGKLYSRGVLEGFFFDEGLPLGEDLAYSMRLLNRARRIGVAGEVWYHYRQRPDSKVHSYCDDAVDESRDLMESLRALNSHGGEYDRYWRCRAMREALVSHMRCCRRFSDYDVVRRTLSDGFWQEAAAGLDLATAPMRPNMKLVAHALKHGWNRTFWLLVYLHKRYAARRVAPLFQTSP